MSLRREIAVVARLNLHTCFMYQPDTACGIKRTYFYNRGCQFSSVIRLNQKSRLPVLNQFGDTARRCTDHRYSNGHCLHDRHWYAVLGVPDRVPYRWKGEGRRFRKCRLNLLRRCITGDFDGLTNLKVCSQFRQRTPLRPVAKYQDLMIEPPIQQQA